MPKSKTIILKTLEDGRHVLECQSCCYEWGIGSYKRCPMCNHKDPVYPTSVTVGMGERGEGPERHKCPSEKK